MTSFEQYVWFSFASARGASGPPSRISASPSQLKDSGTGYDAPSAEALATQTPMSRVSRCSVSRRR
jgi:hypothetical protein